jgi:putative membrane protein
MLLNFEERDKLEELVRDSEAKTDAEIVVVLARRSDSYLYAPSLVAAVAGMLVPFISIYWPFWLDTHELVLVQMSVFISLATFFRIPALQRNLVPKRTKFFRASNLAMRHFLAQGVHTTKDNLGVMIFISEFERYIEIVVDHGVSERISEDVWAKAVNLAIPFLKQNKAFDALNRIIGDVGKILQDEIPITEDKQELPNHVIMI